MLSRYVVELTALLNKPYFSLLWDTSVVRCDANNNSSVIWQFRTSVFNKVVRWHRLDEMENVYAAYNFSHFAIYLPNFIKIGGNLMEF